MTLAEPIAVTLQFAAGLALTNEELTRRIPVDLGDLPQKVWICSAEDIILQKLIWYEKGSRISERQWSDLVGVMKVQQERLNLEYLRRWSGSLKLANLLEKALDEAGLH